MKKQPRKRVLVVSAESPWRVGLVELLAGAGYEVSVAPDPAEALAPIRERTVDVVVAGTSGRTTEGTVLLEELRQCRQKLPVVVVTDVNDVDLYLDAMNRGAFEYLVQPLSAAEFLTVVRKALEWSPRRRAA